MSHYPGCSTTPDVPLPRMFRYPLRHTHRTRLRSFSCGGGGRTRASSRLPSDRKLVASNHYMAINYFGVQARPRQTESFRSASAVTRRELTSHLEIAPSTCRCSAVTRVPCVTDANSERGFEAPGEFACGHGSNVLIDSNTPNVLLDLRIVTDKTENRFLYLQGRTHARQGITAAPLEYNQYLDADAIGPCVAEAHAQLAVLAKQKLKAARSEAADAGAAGAGRGRAVTTAAALSQYPAGTASPLRTEWIHLERILDENTQGGLRTGSESDIVALKGRTRTAPPGLREERDRRCESRLADRWRRSRLEE
ncbi:hypothetical protein EVAR_10807_1 [Eumeta japonica]|uniref:Uncharacterized protein n=1 Tax=Eumeta variegata TaxID=151549 RepID=A0A4C1Y9I0_EUMVA|nr:hypothetical protein EVAR_10807_1 [Eumeta japonica]